MPAPPLLKLPDVAAYREHYLRKYCRGVIITHDGIRVYFRDTKFGHAFYESSRRNADKDVFCMERAERMNWIEAALMEPTAKLRQGWDKRVKKYVETRRVSVVYGDYIVVIDVSRNKNGEFKANFVTAYVGTDTTVQKILKGPEWVQGIKNGR